MERVWDGEETGLGLSSSFVLFPPPPAPIIANTKHIHSKYICTTTRYSTNTKPQIA
jgi:hypothetical protein